MKKSLVLLILLFLLPNVYALIELNEITPKTYNFGDTLKATGFIIRENSFNGLLKSDLICQKDKLPIISRFLDLSANEKYNFLEDITIPKITTGDCNLRIYIEENGNLLDEKNSDVFKITKELNGNFILINSRVQLGSNVDVTGDVYKINGKRIDGVATVYFKKDKNVLFIDTKNINEGKFTFSIPSNYTSVGSYSIDFDVRDANGNENTFLEAIKFDITNLLNIALKIDRNQTKPGGSFEIFGSVTDIYGKRVDRGTFIIKFYDKELSGNILLGDINQKISVDSNIKSGFHNIIIEVKDEFGNKGEEKLNIDILSKADRVEIKSDKDSYRPGESIKINSFVYDQGNDLVDKEIEIEIRDSSGVKKIIQKIKKEFTFALPLISKPGEWTIRVISGALKNEKKVYVSELKNVSYKIEGQMLAVTNIGNVDFNDILNINLNGVTSSSSLSKKVYLEPGESTSIDLGKEVTTGIYKVIINNNLFDNVKIEGRSLIDYKDNLNLIFILIVLLILGVLLYKKRGVNLRKYFRKDKKEFVNYVDDVKKVLQSKIEQKENLIKKELQNINIKKDHSFKDYITIKPKEDKIDDYRKKSSYLKRREKENEHYKEGLFNMFNK